MRLPAHISGDILAWVAETPQDGGHVDNEAARHGGLALMGTIGAVWSLRPDGALWEFAGDFGRPLVPFDERFHTAAPFAGTRSHPWREELLPSRPSDAVECDTGVGQGVTAAAAYCSHCSALGWLISTSLRNGS